MRIAQVAPLAESVPPKLYGGTERIVSYLTEELVALGHDVTLFASGDSQTSAKLSSVWPTALRFDRTVRDHGAPTMMMLADIFRRAEDFDVIHFHLDYVPNLLFGCKNVPFVSTLHGRLDSPELHAVFRIFPNSPVVSISKSQQLPLPHAKWIDTVLHGIPQTLLEPVSSTQTYLAFLGRISPEKRPDYAIEIAKLAGIPLKLAAKVDRVDQDYFDTRISPLLEQGKAELIGEISEREKSSFLSGALALLMPIDWPEPFGLVMVEAMACGTPVIAFNRGSVPEIIEDGVTGFIVNNVEEAVKAVSLVHQLDRSAIRKKFEERFTAKRMASDYVKIYQLLVKRKEESSIEDS
jgi:glycosyltransferase involved in cell wall biosynthesis